MLKNQVLFIFIFLLVVGCKNEKLEFENQLIVKLSVIILEDDELDLFYNSAFSPNFTANNNIKRKIKGSHTPQDVFFILKDDEYPKRIRIDFGNNRNQKQVEIKEIKLLYNKAFKIFTKEEVKLFFKANEYFDFDFETLKGVGVEKNDRYDPYLESMNLSKFINNLILY
tara:strand:+ start:3232 stop:3738 length:507 start_codon:yes stop_codon:yes gene_type:complete